MRCRERVWIVYGWLLTGLAVAPLAAQPASTPQIIHPLPRLRPESGQIQNVLERPVLIFDADTKEYDASPGEKVAPFTFNLTNVWTNEITIDNVHSSCGCTTAILPTNVPWHIPPQGGGPIHVQVMLARMMGLITKTVTFYYKISPDSATTLTHVINLKVNIPLPPAISGMMTVAERNAAMTKAGADAQAIFKGTCAQCHVDKGRNAMGQNLYAADCGICHESSHRARLVPDLHALKQVTDFDYWKTTISSGKPHTMMPAFAAAQGGPLTEAQIISLATYLNHTLSHHFSAAISPVANAPLTRATAAP